MADAPVYSTNLPTGSVPVELLGHDQTGSAKGTKKFAIADVAALIMSLSGQSVVLRYATLAALNADLTPSAGAIARVYGDTDANNGLYIKSGNSGTGSWGRLDQVTSAQLQAAVTALQAQTAGIDPTLTADAGLRTRSFGAILDTAPATPESFNTVTPRDIAYVQGLASARATELRAIQITGYAPYGPGANHTPKVGQSFGGGAITMQKLLSVKDPIVVAGTAVAGTGLDAEFGPRMAKMVGLSERCQTGGNTYDQFGPRELRDLIATLTNDGTFDGTSGAHTGDGVLYTMADIQSGNFSGSSRGETGAPVAAFMFERLWQNALNIDTPDTSRFDIVTNVCKTDASLQQISTGFGRARAIDAANAAKAAIAAGIAAGTLPPNIQSRVSIWDEDHGQADNSAGLATADYTSAHKAFRDDMDAAVRVGIYGQRQRALWLASQAGGGYASLNNYTSQAQLNMSLDNIGHPDYICVGNDYPYPNFGYIPAPHPFALNRHVSGLGQRQRGALKARARFMTQVRGRNWFMTHMSHLFFRDGSPTLLVGMPCMAGPLRINQPVPYAGGPPSNGMTLSVLPGQGFTIVVRGRYVTIRSVQLVAENVIQINCAEPFSSTYPPTVSLGDLSIGGVTNIRDSFTMAHLVPYRFISGYHDINLNQAGYDDAAQLENIPALIGSTDVGNWAACQAKIADPLPTSFLGVLN